MPHSSHDYKRAICGLSFINFVLGMFVFGFSLSSLHLETVPLEFWSTFKALWASTCAAVVASLTVIVCAFTSISTLALAKRTSKTRLIIRIVSLSVLCVFAFCTGLSNVIIAPMSFPKLGILNHNFCMNLFYENSGLLNMSITDKWAPYEFNITISPVENMHELVTKIHEAEMKCIHEQPLNLITFCGIILIIISLVLVGHMVVSYNTYKQIVAKEMSTERSVRFVANELNNQIEQ